MLRPLARGGIGVGSRHLENGQVTAADVQISLGEGDFNAAIAQPRLNGKVQITLDHQLLGGLGNPHQQVEIEGTVSKALKKYLGGRHGQHLGVTVADRHQHLPHLGGVRTVGHPHGDANAGNGVAVAPVDHLLL